MNVIEKQGETILSLVNEIFKNGKFVCPSDDEVEDSSKVVGEVSEYEKAIVMAAESESQKINVDENPLTRRLAASNAKALASLFWASIHNRIGEKSFEEAGLSLKKDWKIVSIEEDDDCCSIRVISLGFPFGF